LDGDSKTYGYWSEFDCKGWRLPTEAEWEYAARGGEDFIYAGSDNLDEIAWYCENSENQIQRVAQQQFNGFDLYDMSGNVYEWVWDWYGNYSSENQSDPTGPSTEVERVFRGGGGASSDESRLRVSERFITEPANRKNTLGFRLVRSP
jgi:formylglycine-generating enzyme